MVKIIQAVVRRGEMMLFDFTIAFGRKRIQKLREQIEQDKLSLAKMELDLKKYEDEKARRISEAASK